MTESNSLVTTDSPWWAKLLDRFGVSTALLAVIIYCCIHTGQWLGTNVITPVTSQHIEFLRATHQTLQQQTVILKHIDDAIDKRNTIMEASAKRTEAILTTAIENKVLNEEMLDAIKNKPRD